MVRRQRQMRSAAPWSVVLAASGALALALLGRPASADTRAEQTRLIDCPTAGLIERGQIGLGLRLWRDGGLLARVDAGALNRLNIGVSYGGRRIIGDGAVDWYPRLEANARYRVVQENRSLPAVVIGYDTQGFGDYLTPTKRYRIKARGLFLALSKNYLHPLGQIGLHGGASLALEDSDNDDATGWVGVDATLSEELSVAGEYDLGLNDDGPAGLGGERGYLNAGANWAVAPRLVMSFAVKNLLESGGNPVSRELSVTFCQDVK